jgi:N-acetyl-gamma-glutamyl-phosphate reductase
MTRVHVAGAAGYAASELIRLVARHPQLELGALESTSHAGQAIGAHVPYLRGLERAFDPPGTIAALARPHDVVVLGGGADAARAQAPDLLANDLRVVDLSDAFRLQAHAGSAIYGLPERHRDAIAGARFIANPGCYPTATLLALLPLAAFSSELVQLIVDAKSGITGAGRNPATASLFGEVDGDVRAYGLSGHRHQPEIEQELAGAGIHTPLVFTPHVVPLKRGLLADAYAVFAREPDDAAIAAAFARAYGGNRFVRILSADQAPSLVAVAGTNDAEIAIGRRGKVVRVITAIDNLGKGAAGQALQNINLMLGFPEESGFDACAIVG